MRSIITLFLLSLLTAHGFAQTVSGKVTEDDGSPLPGVNIRIEGTSEGTITDADGFYKLNVNADQKLIFSFVGFKTSTVAVGSQTNINVVLEIDQTELDEVVVVGYGTMRKSDITGATVSVKAEESVARQYNTVDEMLYGRAAGVQVTGNSGNPGMGISVRIRGTNSLRGNNEPLYVVDGVIITSAGEDAASGSTDGNSLQEQQNGLNGLNPRDIENIEVLKDASATAIYGSRGSNGVVLITTKQGTSGKMKVDVYATTSASLINKKIPVLSGVDYAKYRNEASLMDGADPLYYINGEDVYTIDYTNGIPNVNPIPSELVNWQDEIYDYGLAYNAGASFSGGSEKGSYYVSAGFNRIGGIVESSLIQSGDLRVNVTQNISDNLKIDGRTSFFYSEGNFAQDGSRAGGQRSFIKNVIQYNPVVDGEVNDFAEDLELSNPYSWIKDYDDKAKEFRAQASLALTYKLPVQGLRIQIRGGGNAWIKERRRFYGLTTFQGDISNGRLSIGEQQKYAYTVNNLLIYNRKFRKVHSINATLGFTFDGNYREDRTYEVSDFATTYFRTDGPEYGALISGPYSTYPREEKVHSYLARANYSYKDKYIATATFRIDGSSKFSPENRYSYFPSFSLAWRASEEDFISSLGIFYNLKLRAGWGQTGSQAIQPYNTFGNYGVSYYSRPDNSTGIAFVPSNIANPDLKWETTTQINVGLDMSFLEGRLSATVDAYEKRTNDLLQQISLPTSTGFGSMLINRGSISNRGIDLELNAVVLDKNDFMVNIGGNISFNRNTILELGIPESPVYINGEESMESFYLGDNISTGSYFKYPANIFMEDQPMGRFWGYVTDGIYQEGAAEMLNGFQPGDIKIIDQNGDGVIDLADRTFIGDPNPDFVYGANVQFTWKRLTANILLSGVYGNDVANGLGIEIYNAEGLRKNIAPAAYHDAWRPDKPSNTYPRILYGKENGAAALNDRYIEDGSYFRLSNVTIGYDLPLEKVFSRFHVYVSGQNLLTITGYSGYEPNVTSFLYNGNIQGVDWNGFPNVRTLLVGLNLNF